MGKKMAKFRFFGFEFVNFMNFFAIIVNLNIKLICKFKNSIKFEMANKIYKFNDLKSCFLSGKMADLLCFVLCICNEFV